MKLVVPALALAALALAGCGGASKTPTAGGSPPSTAPAEVKVQLADGNADVQALTGRVATLEQTVAAQQATITSLQSTVQALQKDNQTLDSWVPILQKIQTQVLGAPPYGGGGDLEQVKACLGAIRAYVYSATNDFNFGPAGVSPGPNMCNYFG